MTAIQPRPRERTVMVDRDLRREAPPRSPQSEKMRWECLGARVTPMRSQDQPQRAPVEPATVRHLSNSSPRPRHNSEASARRTTPTQGHAQSDGDSLRRARRGVAEGGSADTVSLTKGPARGRRKSVEKRMGRLRVPSLRRARATELGRRGVLASPVVVPMIGHVETLAFLAQSARGRSLRAGGRSRTVPSAPNSSVSAPRATTPCPSCDSDAPPDRFAR